MSEDVDLPDKEWPVTAEHGDLENATMYVDKARSALNAAVIFCGTDSEEFRALREHLEEAHKITRAVLGRFLVLEREGHL